MIIEIIFYIVIALWLLGAILNVRLARKKNKSQLLAFWDGIIAPYTFPFEWFIDRATTSKKTKVEEKVVNDKPQD